MKLHLLLTSHIIATLPETAKTIMDFGHLEVVFDDDLENTFHGLHCVIEDTEENIINWLKPFDWFIKGNGYPQMEQFDIVHIKKENG